MNLTVDRDVQQDVGTEQDVAVATSGLPLPPASHQVVVGDIPAEPPGFRPRAGLLAELDRSGARVSVIHGMAGRAGLGATQLAAAYARAKLAADWRLVAWVNAADTGNVQAGLAAVAEATGLTEGGSGRDIADVGRAVRRLLETGGDRCLLVFDDAADPEALRPFVPADGAARVLITSTRHPILDFAAAVPVDVLSAGEAVSFLTGRTGQDDEAGAAAVAAELGHRPLALALAAPVIRAQRHGYARYLERLQTIPAEVSATGSDGQPFPQGVARAVLLSLAAIRIPDKTGMCARIMAVMAVLSSAGVSRKLLYIAGRTGVLANGGRRVEAALVDQALEWLSDLSLLNFSVDGQSIMMHRLVAQVVRRGLVRRQRLGAVCWVAASVLEAHAIAVAGSQDRPAVRRIPQQVTALLDNTAGLAEEVDEELAEILLRLRFIALYHLIELGDSAPQAIAIGEPLTADLERMAGPGHPDTLNARNSLAAAYLASGRVADAIPLFEQTLAVLQRQLGSDHPDILTSQNNLASAYQDAGRVAEAIQLYELNLAERQRLLGADDPGTLTSGGNLAAAYLASGRVANAIPLLEQTLSSRERVLGPDHPDTQTSRRNLAKAYQDAGRAAEAIPLLERIPASRPRALRPDGWTVWVAPPVEQASTPADTAAKAPPADFRRPPADPARPVLPADFRRPPVDPAGRPPSDPAAGPSAKLPDRSFPSRTQDAPQASVETDYEMVAAIAAGDPAGIALAYDRYAAALYGYCHWVLQNSAGAAESLQDTFVLAAATVSELPEPAKLRPWLFALARNECRHRIRPGSATRGEADEANQRVDQGQEIAAADPPIDAADLLADATMQFPIVSEPAEVPGDLADATVRFPMVSEPAEVPGDLADATMQFSAVGALADATMQFRMISKPANGTDGLADVNDYLGQAELRALIRSVLADIKPREREVIELGFRHDLYDSDLAIALGVSVDRAQALAARTRGRLEKSLAALRTALAGRQACPVMGELLADWDGQLTEQTRDLVAWHIEQCQTCINQTRGTLHPTVLSGLLPLAPLPPELREKVLSRISSTSEDAMAYRRQVVRRAESKWAALFSRAIRRMSWDSIRANPGTAVATAAVAVWIAVAVTVTLLTFAGSRAAHALVTQSPGAHPTHAPTVQTSIGTSSRSSAAVRPTAPTSRSATARPSPTVTRPVIYVSSPAQSSPSPEGSGSPSPKPSGSPSKSPSPKPSGSPSPSHTTSPSASSSPSPTA